MSPSHLHIVSFDVPFPPDYGGVIDIFFKVRALAGAGVKIFLHCFEYGRPEAIELERYCEKVYYYKRRMSKRFLLSRLPFIVISRRSDLLMERLLSNDYPILFEGLHSCFHLSDPRLKGRKLLLRTHNIEHEYYRSLALVEKNLFRKVYFEREAVKLQRFEGVMKEATAILAISRADEVELTGRYSHVMLVSAFHPNEEVEVPPGIGRFSLYHGNLEVGENNEAALYLAGSVFAGTDLRLVIAGKNPSPELREVVALHENISLRANIPTHEIDKLIREAQINVLPTFQATGIKLKLLAALFNGRHCIVNTQMVQHTGLEKLCSICDDPASMRMEVERLMHVPVGKDERTRRETVLSPVFSNRESIRKLLTLIQ